MLQTKADLQMLCSGMRKRVDKHDWTFNMNNMNTSLSYAPHNRVSQKQYSPQGQIEQPVFGSK